MEWVANPSAILASMAAIAYLTQQVLELPCSVTAAVSVSVISSDTQGTVKIVSELLPCR
jgi:hypothetical protein